MPRRDDRHRRLKRTAFPRWTGRLLQRLARRRVRQWDRALAHVEAAQMAQLRAILRRGAGTEFGRAHGFQSLHRHADFAAAVPIRGYDEFVPAYERMMRGARNVLLPEFVQYWGNSSGTSGGGREKFLPISERQIRHQRGAGFDVLARFLVNTPTCTDFLSGFSLGLYPPPKFRRVERATVTNNPGLMSTRLPAPIRALYLPGRAVKAIEDYDDKLARIAQEYLDHDVRAISGTTCWFSVMFDQLLATARQLGREARTVRDIWPNLAVLLGGGVSAEPYRPLIRDRVGGEPYLCDTYNATEGGILATTDTPGQAGLLMIVDRGVFFEFVPLEDVDSPAPARVPLWQVEPERPYAIVLTTSSGQYAYRLGDIVRFVSVAPPRLEFAGRLGGNLSTTQELTTHAEIERSVMAAAAAYPSGIVDFAAGAEVGVAGTGKARYVLFVEFAAGRSPSDRRAFVDAFDAALCEANRVYREHRAGDAAIVAPRLVVLPAGAVARYLREVRAGNVQAKFPRIVDDHGRDTLLGYAAN